MKRVIIAMLAAGVLLAQTDQKTNKENQVRDRGQTPSEGALEMPHQVQGRRQPARSYHGLLLDAQCQDRTNANLRQPPEAPVIATQQPTSKSQADVSVGSKTLERERAGVMEHQVPDLRTRQQDPSCAITSGTKAFLVLLDSGKLFRLDEGGNTLAMEAVETSPAGRALFNGTGPAFKPAVTLRGRVNTDELIVEKIIKLQ